MKCNILLKNLTLTNKESIAYRERDGGFIPLILIHGNMSSSAFWDVLIDSLPSNYKIYAPDMRGFGDSSYNNPFSTLQEISMDLIEWAQILKIGSMHIVGWSTGGGVAMEMVISQQIPILSLILLSSVGPKGYQLQKSNDEAKLIQHEYIKTKEELKNDKAKVIPMLKAYSNKDTKFLKLIWSTLIYGEKQPEEAKFNFYMMENLKQRNYIDVIYSLSYFNISHEENVLCKGNGNIDHIKCPTLILWGDADKVITQASMESLKEGIKNSKIIVIKNGGHSLITDDTKLLSSQIHEFISQFNKC